jgi:hypothetical protein
VSGHEQALTVAQGFSVVIVLTRVCGRKIRSNVLFREDWIMLAALIPLLIRMAIIHVVLIYDTNNIQTVGIDFIPTELYHRSIGSRLVLASRIFYAMFIWFCKLTVSEFLKRITIRIWRRSYELVLQGIRIFLFLTFGAVVIATLTECHPFPHYWQVIPDPGPSCRQGYAQLITMGTCDMITDCLLVAFPIPIVIRSGQTWRRKLQLSTLFSLSIIMIAVTGARIPEVIANQGRQQYRTVWASSEILAATAVTNGVILGSFVRDKGTKKNKFKSQSVSDSIDRASVRRPTMVAAGSDEDLFHSLGIRVPEHLKDKSDSLPRPAPAALPASKPMSPKDSQGLPELKTIPQYVGQEEAEDTISEDPLPSPKPSIARSVSFFDVGGLLEGSKPSLDSRSHSIMADSAGSGTITHDFAPTPEQSRRGSRAFLQDMGAISMLPGRPPYTNGYSRRHSDVTQNLSRFRNAPIGVLVPMLERQETHNSLQDPGGLLSDLHGDGGSRSSTEGRTPLQKHSSQLSLQDVGGLLSNDHVPQTSARATQRLSDHVRQDTTPEIPEEPSQVFETLDGIELQDPGGLLRA